MKERKKELHSVNIYKSMSTYFKMGCLKLWLIKYVLDWIREIAPLALQKGRDECICIQ